MVIFRDQAVGQKESGAESFLAEHREKVCNSLEARRAVFWQGALESPSILAWVVDHVKSPMQVLP